MIRGVWQCIPQSERPVITIYRNDNAHDPTLKYKATHLPVIMDREDYQPFQYDPSATRQGKRYFIQGLFEFDPDSNLFIWREDLEPPTDKIPPYRKADKIGVEGAVGEKTFKPVPEKVIQGVQEQSDKAKCDLKKILDRFGKKKLDNLKAEMPIKSYLLVRPTSIVWKKKVDIITEMEEETGHKYDRLEKIIQLQIYQC